MTSKTKKSKRQIVADAKRLLRSNWTEDRWIVFEDDQDWSPGDGWWALNRMMEDAKQSAANPKCQVCAEGAVYLACALAGDETDVRAQEIIDTLDRHTPSGDIMSVNDSRGLDPVLAVFEQAEKEGAFDDA